MIDPGLRVSLLLQVDRAFSDYSIRLRPDEARAFAQSSIANGEKNDSQVFQLLILLDETIPLSVRGEANPGTGRGHHAYQIGREVGKRLLTVDLMKIHFKSEHDFTPMFQIFQGYANTVKAIFNAEEIDNGWSVIFTWV